MDTKFLVVKPLGKHIEDRAEDENMTIYGYLTMLPVTLCTIIMNSKGYGRR
jgi:hypothetical protein